MSEFIRSIGRAYVNNIGFDLYENKDGTATIRPVKLGIDFPKKNWIKFDSVAIAEAKIDDVVGNDVFGADRVQKLKEEWL